MAEGSSVKGGGNQALDQAWGMLSENVKGAQKGLEDQVAASQNTDKGAQQVNGQVGNGDKKSNAKPTSSAQATQGLNVASLMGS